ncbi:cysteine hydrolase family protein [Herbaspirillum sp. YR522]|uniref:cysteine hydrolase family protein n=1 Tax=Herbaspirillum sp. YR522 TaxID=1144342 RepID=UPI00026F767A|nr:cysteine hydrolase family protein [Herbaspirillum sp. YR522]EJN08153.1 nicotinamidase-like amidase [Herbaspirillum sp. YR522]
MPTALLIIDVQQALCVGPTAVADAARIIGNINDLARRARAAGAPVIVVQHEDGASLAHGSAGWQLAAGLAAGQGDTLLRKRGSDAFHQTDLQSMLKTRHVSQLVVCGMQTEFCVESTVRRALALGYPVTLAADGHTTADNAVLAAAQIVAHHHATLANLGAYGVRAGIMAGADIGF